MDKKTILKMLVAAGILVMCTLSVSYYGQQEDPQAVPAMSTGVAEKSVQKAYSVPLRATPTPAPTATSTPTPALTATPEPTTAPVEESVTEYSTPEPTNVPEEVPVVEAPVEVNHYNADELEILALIIYQEAGGDYCSDSTRQYVGSVFLNRVNSSAFPDTFYEVATQPAQYGTLSYTGIQWPDRAQYEGEQGAVSRAYSIAEELLVSGSVLPENVVWQAEFPQGCGTYAFQDNMYFCY